MYTLIFTKSDGTEVQVQFTPWSRRWNVVVMEALSIIEIAGRKPMTEVTIVDPEGYEECINVD